jgi:hypothetical protein
MYRKSTSISSSDKEGTIVHDVFIESGDFGESSPHIDVQRKYIYHFFSSFCLWDKNMY